MRGNKKSNIKNYNLLFEENKNFYKAIIDNMNEGVLVHNGEKILYTNKAGIELLKGRSATDIVGEPVFKFIHQDNKKLVKERINKVFSQKEPLPYVEEIFTDLEGNSIYVQVSAVKLSLKNVGDVSLVIIRDMSSEKNKTKALEESELKYRAITENSPDVIMRFDREYRHLYVNKAAEKQTGISVEKFIGKRHEELGFPKHMCDFWHNEIQKVFDTGKPHLVEFDLETPSGIVNIEWRLFPEFSDKSGISTVLAISRDITSRKKIEDKLKKSEKNYRTVFNSINDGIFIHNIKDGKIIDVNESACKMYGYKREEFIGKDMGFLSDEKSNSNKKIMDYIKRAMKGEPQTFEWKAKRKNGEIFWVEISQKLTKIGDKKAIISVIRNIEERKKMEERLKTIEKMEAIGRLVGGIAHDFNNILTVINGNAQMLQREVKFDHKIDKKLSNIINSGKRGEKLISKLLAFSRKQIFEPKTVSLNKIINEMKDMLRSLISEEIRLTFNLENDLPLVKADSNQIERILINMIVNARDAIFEKEKAENKTIEIKTEKFYMDKNFVKNHLGSRQGEYILLTIRDTGIGMTEEIREKIFDPFFTTKAEGKGTGLGLSMVWGIVKQNKGYLDVYSEPGMGTIFKIYWPTTKNKNETKKDKHPNKPEFTEGNETILIVEDSNDIREFAKTFLKSIGYTIIEAENGVEGLKIFKEKNAQIDLIFTDIIMPEMSGKKFADKAKKIKPDVKILFTSGYPNEQFSDTGLITEQIYFLKKPYSISELSNIIRKILDN